MNAWYLEKAELEDLVEKLGHAVWNEMVTWKETTAMEPHEYPIFEQAIEEAICPHLKTRESGGKFVPVDRAFCWMLWGEWKRLCRAEICGMGKPEEKAALAGNIADNILRLAERLYGANPSWEKRRQALIQTIVGVFPNCGHEKSDAAGKSSAA